MTRDQQTTRKGKRVAVRRRRTRSLAALSTRERNTGRSGTHADAASRRRRKAQYQYAASGVLPRLRLQPWELNPSRVMASFLLGAMIGLLIWFFADDSFFVYTAEVRGNSLVSAEEVYRAGGLDCMSIFYIDPEKVAQDIERRIPGVTRVRVQCALPGRVSVQISEQDVRYLWRTANAAFLVDGEGRILKVDDGTHTGLLVIRDLDSQSQLLSPGDRVDGTALSTVSGLRGLLPEVQEYEYSRDRGVSVSDARGWRVYFGDAEELPQKVATLQSLVLKFVQENKTVSVIDVRFVGSPYYQ